MLWTCTQGPYTLTLCLYLSPAHSYTLTLPPPPQQKTTFCSDWCAAAETPSWLSGTTSSSLDIALSQQYPAPCNRIYRVVVELRFPLQVAPAERVGRDTGTIQSHQIDFRPFELAGDEAPVFGFES